MSKIADKEDFMNSQSYRRIHEKGQALVETAIAIFVILLLAFGITEFGRAMYTKNTLTNAARTGARQAVVTLELTNAPDPGEELDASCNYGANPSGNDLVYMAICNSLFAGIKKDDVSVTIAGASNPKAVTNDAISVTVTLNTFSSVVPKLFGSGGMVPFPNSLKGEATMRYE